MEKRKPHYRLAEVKAVVADRTSRPFTRTALEGGREIGLSETQMRRVVRSLTQRHFYKSMTTLRDTAVWQDVYHGASPLGVPLYIKITGYEDGRPPVIQFKASE